MKTACGFVVIALFTILACGWTPAGSAPQRTIGSSLTIADPQLRAIFTTLDRTRDDDFETLHRRGRIDTAFRQLAVRAR